MSSKQDPKCNPLSLSLYLYIYMTFPMRKMSDRLKSYSETKAVSKVMVEVDYSKE